VSGQDPISTQDQARAGPETMRAQCIACRAEIPRGATRCSTCSSDQRRWISWLQLLGAIAAGITLIASGATYVVSGLRRLAESQRDAEIEIVAFASSGLKVFGNTGNYGAYIAYIKFSAEIPYKDDGSSNVMIFRDNVIVPINRSVGDGQFTSIGEFNGEQNDLRPLLDFRRDRWKKIVQDAKFSEECLGVDYYASNDAQLGVLKTTYGEALQTFPANARLRYASGKDGAWRELVLSTVGLFSVKDLPVCQEILSRYQLET
jgi:hypothetical protein